MSPVMYSDGTGCAIDFVLDLFFLGWSIVDVIKDPTGWKNWAAVGMDLAFMAIPFATGGSQIIKVGNKIDNVQDLSRVTLIGRNMERVTNTANIIKRTDNLYDTWKGYNKVANFSKSLANGISIVHNGGWLFNKPRKGYTVIDIGLTTAHRGIGLWYGTERIVSTI